MKEASLYTGTKRHNWLVQYIKAKFHNIGHAPNLPTEIVFEKAAIISVVNTRTRQGDDQ